MKTKRSGAAATASHPSFWQRYKRNQAAVGGLVLVGFICFAALFTPFLAPVDPFELSDNRLHQPFTENILGTDHLGRDMLSRLLHGARTSIIVGILAATVAVVVGVAIGSVSGFFSGRIDTVLMRLTEGVQVVPTFFLAVLIVALFGGGLGRVILVIGLLAWPPTARTTRAQFLSLREVEFVEAARSLGFGSFHVMLREILPNAVAPIIVLLSLGVAEAVLLEASLGFVGLSDPTVISWGKMLNDAQAYLRAAWWVSVVPGAAIFALVMGVNLVGDGLNDALNPHSRR